MKKKSFLCKFSIRVKFLVKIRNIKYDFIDLIIIEKDDRIKIFQSFKNF